MKGVLGLSLCSGLVFRIQFGRELYGRVLILSTKAALVPGTRTYSLLGVSNNVGPKYRPKTARLFLYPKAPRTLIVGPKDHII